jgi:hypothetical protein
VPHVALTGPSTLLDVCAPESAGDLSVTRIDGTPSADAIAAADAAVAFAPAEDEVAALAELELPALLWWPDTAPAWLEADRPAGESVRAIAGAPGAAGVWRSVPLPVADALFADPIPGPPSAAWLGPHGARRDEYLRFFDPDVAIADDHPEATIAVNLLEDRACAEHRAHIALARGQLLVSEPLLPSRGLEPGIDYVELAALDEVHVAVENALRAPRALGRIRLRGRGKAELFRSSAVVGRLVGDLLLELAAPAGASR